VLLLAADADPPLTLPPTQTIWDAVTFVRVLGGALSRLVVLSQYAPAQSFRNQRPAVYAAATAEMSAVRVSAWWSILGWLVALPPFGASCRQTPLHEGVTATAVLLMVVHFLALPLSRGAARAAFCVSARAGEAAQRLLGVTVTPTAPVATPAAIAGLPSLRFAADRGAADAAADLCAICLEGFEPWQSVAVLPCKHQFHHSCVSEWLSKYKGTCPLCNETLAEPSTPRW